MRKLLLVLPLAAALPVALPASAAPTTPRCHTADLAGAIIDEDAGAGNRYARLILTNTSAHDCHTKGFIGGQFVGTDGKNLPTSIVRAKKKPKTVTIRAGAAGSVKLHWTVIPSGNNTSCPTDQYLRVTPPDETTTLQVYFGDTACEGRLDVGPVRDARPIGN